MSVMDYSVICPSCREKFEMAIYREDGELQDFIYDCDTCSHPIEIMAKWDGTQARFILKVDRGSGFEEMPYLG